MVHGRNIRSRLLPFAISTFESFFKLTKITTIALGTLLASRTFLKLVLLNLAPVSVLLSLAPVLLSFKTFLLSLAPVLLSLAPVLLSLTPILLSYLSILLRFVPVL